LAEDQAGDNMQENNRKKNLQALGVTIGVHALLLAGLLFAGFSAPPPLPNQDLGMEVNLGTSDDGMGDEQPLNPNPPAAEAPAPAEQPPAATHEDVEPPQDIATDNDADAPEVKKPEKPVVKPPKELPKKLEPKPEKPVKKPAAEMPPKPAPPAPAPKPKAVFGGVGNHNGPSGNGANGSNNSTGEGNTGKPGDRGQINGDPNAKGYTGGGGLGGGRSDFRLSGRSLVGRPNVTYDSNESGYVAINIKVDKQGNVIAANYSMSGSTISNDNLIGIAKRAAMQIKYNASPDAPEVQFGLIRFYFKAE
jgi:outer membrane biosynthesis protein TonB